MVGGDFLSAAPSVADAIVGDSDEEEPPDADFDDSVTGEVPIDATADDILAAFATSMRAFARAKPESDAACTVPALLGVLRADGAASDSIGSQVARI